jgi:hypothetical protein
MRAWCGVLAPVAEVLLFILTTSSSRIKKMKSNIFTPGSNNKHQLTTWSSGEHMELLWGIRYCCLLTRRSDVLKCGAVFRFLSAICDPRHKPESASCTWTWTLQGILWSWEEMKQWAASTVTQGTLLQWRKMVHYPWILVSSVNVVWSRFELKC